MTAKNEVFIGLYHENRYLVGGIKIWWGNLLEGFFQVVGKMNKFLVSGGTLPHPPVGKTLPYKFTEINPSGIFFNKFEHIIPKIHFAEYLDVNVSACFVNMQIFSRGIMYHKLKNSLMFHDPTSLASAKANTI